MMENYYDAEDPWWQDLASRMGTDLRDYMRIPISAGDPNDPAYSTSYELQPGSNEWFTPNDIAGGYGLQLTPEAVARRQAEAEEKSRRVQAAGLALVGGAAFAGAGGFGGLGGGGGSGALGFTGGNSVLPSTANLIGRGALFNSFLPGESGGIPNVMGGGGGGLSGGILGELIPDSGTDWVNLAKRGVGALGARRGADAPPSPGGGTPTTIPSAPLGRIRNPVQPDYFTYGKSGGEHRFFTDSVSNDGPATPPASGAAPGAGALPTGYVPNREINQQLLRGMAFADGGSARGPGSGRDDTIEALLSDGEYVIDAESVALLGDGSLDEGAARLDQLRENLRKHKGVALAKGKFTPPAKSPEEYIPGMKKGGYASEKQARLMRAVAHGWKPDRIKGPSRKVANEFVDEKDRKAHGGNVQLGVTELPPINSNRPAPLPNPTGQYSRPIDEALARLSEKLRAESRLTESEMQRLMRVGPQSQEEAQALLRKLQSQRSPTGLAKGGRVPRLAWDRRRASPEERQKYLDAVRRFEAAFQQADHPKPGEDLGRDPYNQPPRKKKAHGGRVHEARSRVESIRKKMAQGGPAVADMNQLADKLEAALKIGDPIQIDAAMQPVVQLAKGGKVLSNEVVNQVLEKYRPKQPASPEELQEVIRHLRAIKPDSEVLRQYDSSQRPRIYRPSEMREKVK